MTAALQWLTGRNALVTGQGDAAQEVARALKAAGAEVQHSSIGSGDEAAIAAEMTALEGGGFDILVHGAIAETHALSHDIDMPAWRHAASSNLDLYFLSSAEFARRCLQAGRQGSILFLLPSPQPREGHVVSATLIGALDNLVKSLAVEWARDGIRVNAIASKVCAPGGLGSEAARHSLGKLAAYILSDYGAYISGTVMGVDET